MAKVNLSNLTKVGNVVTKKNNMGSRFLNSFGAIFSGLAVAFICLISLACNESCSVKAIRAYDEFGKNLIETGSAQINPGNNGKLVAIRGSLSFSPVTDPAYRITANSFVLQRYVEMYQWQEEKRGSSTDAEVTYTYTGAWRSTSVNSSRFVDQSYANKPWPSDSAFQNGSVYADDAKLGDFRITPEQLSNLRADIVLKIPESTPLPSGFSRSSDGQYIHNGNLSDPQTGDLRISFRSSEETRASMLGQQQGDAIVSYTAKNGTRIDRLFSGERSGAEMVGQLQAENSVMTWFLRIFLTVLVCLGFSMLLSPVKLLLSIIPFLGKYLGKATKAIAQVIGTIVGVTLSLLVIAISWIAVRPLVGIPLLLIVAGLIVLLNRYKKSKIDNAPEPQPEPAA
ncbi:MAG: TMEM43 family protein [Treponema sp.]|jgi:hypothetical protein|nr:TMEM43 family protein [Treponema sp.]